MQHNKKHLANIREIGLIVSIIIVSAILITTLRAKSVKAVVSTTATVKITVNAQNGKKLTGVRITCINKDTTQTNENGVPIPGTPKFSYLTTKNGNATWYTSAETGHTYSCTPSTGVAYIDGVCYALSGGASGFSLTPGQVKYVTITARLAPGHCTYYDEKKYAKSLPKPAPQYAPISKIKLPQEFTQNGSKTTKFTKLTLQKAKKFNSLVIDNVKYGKIVFLEPVDLSSKQIANNFKQLNKYIKMTHGKISLDSIHLKQLNKRAKLYFYNMNLNENMPILIAKNNEIDQNISNTAKYNKQTQILTIEVNGFSTYTYVPQIKITSASNINTQAYTLTGQISDKDAKIDILLNGQLVAQSLETNEQGHFSITLQLNEGQNTITVQDSNIKTAKTNYTVTVTVKRNFVEKLKLKIQTYTNIVLNALKHFLQKVKDLN